MGNAASKAEVSYAIADAARRILLVDDNIAGVQTMRILLELEGYEVCVATTGEDAIKKFSELQPAIVLLDIGLPDIDGCDLARRLSQAASAHKPMVVALSGWGDEATRARAREAGVEHFFSKPVRFEDLELLLARESNPSGL